MNELNPGFERGLAAIANGDGHEALECFTRIIGDSPRNAAAYRYRAQAHLLLKDRPKAITDLDVAIQLNPKDIQYRIERAAELFKQRQFDRAIEDCEAGLPLHPERADLFGLRGRCHAALGNSTAALQDYERAGAAFEPFKAQLLRELGQFEEIAPPPPV
jgi:tetratricopeptide (TPR) repeat protein